MQEYGSNDGGHVNIKRLIKSLHHKHKQKGRALNLDLKTFPLGVGLHFCWQLLPSVRSITAKCFCIMLSLKSTPSPDAAHPFVLLLRGGGRDPVHGVVALHHAPVGLRLARLDHLVFVVRDEELEAVLGTEPE